MFFKASNENMVVQCMNCNPRQNDNTKKLHPGLDKKYILYRRSYLTDEYNFNILGSTFHDTKHLGGNGHRNTGLNQSVDRFSPTEWRMLLALSAICCHPRIFVSSDQPLGNIHNSSHPRRKIC